MTTRWITTTSRPGMIDFLKAAFYPKDDPDGISCYLFCPHDPIFAGAKPVVCQHCYSNGIPCDRVGYSRCHPCWERGIEGECQPARRLCKGNPWEISETPFNQNEEGYEPSYWHGTSIAPTREQDKWWTKNYTEDEMKEGQVRWQPTFSDLAPSGWEEYWPESSEIDSDEDEDCDGDHKMKSSKPYERKEFVEEEEEDDDEAESEYSDALSFISQICRYPDCPYHGIPRPHPAPHMDMGSVSARQTSILDWLSTTEI